MKFHWSFLRWAVFLSLVTVLSGCGGGGSASPVVTQTSIVRVACVGDSITLGYELPEPARNSYPAVLGRWLGNGYQVRNFGANATTLLKTGSLPYAKQAAFSQAIKFKPNILVVALGTNDSKNLFNDDLRAEFTSDYKALIDAFKKANPDVKVYCCLPIPSQPESRQWNMTLVNDIFPSIKQSVTDEKGEIIDLYFALNGKPELYLDDLHPNVQGASAIAGQIYRALTGMEPPATG